ncbi:MAG: hypothetical protein QXG00_08460 [Candidatus Woesearchaeota archaeon]
MLNKIKNLLNEASDTINERYDETDFFYAVRFSNHIESDIKRNWSGWDFGSVTFENLDDYLRWKGLDEKEIKHKHYDKETGEFEEYIEYRDYISAIEMEEEELGRALSEEERNNFILAWIESFNKDLDIRQYPHSGRWVEVHHDGLSCHVLEDDEGNPITNEAEAEKKAYEFIKQYNYPPSGDQTIGKVELVKELIKPSDKNIGWYLLKIEDYRSEDF